MLILLPPTSISTLFPYTTLFRSLPGATAVANHVLYIRRNSYPCGHEGTRIPRIPGAGDSGSARCTVGVYHLRRAGPALDRKSTRLNSSHRCISYAVFCLKKKQVE